MDGNRIPIQEEEKVSSDNRNIIVDAIIAAVEHNPVFYLTMASIVLYSILMFFFIKRDYVTVQSNPEVQWQLNQIKMEDE